MCVFRSLCWCTDAPYIYLFLLAINHDLLGVFELVCRFSLIAAVDLPAAVG